MENLISKPRVRVCGILIKNDSILLLKHEKMGKMGFIWSPPGGGVNYHETVEEGLIREFKEETCLDIEVLDFLFVNEYMDDRFHAVELFFRVKEVSGTAILGCDPEFSTANQILSDLRYFNEKELLIIPNGQKHNIFSLYTSFDTLLGTKGFYKFKNI